MSILAIIPAREGSKGVPGKNLKKIGEISLLARAIRTAMSTEAIDHVIVSTDSKLIAEEAKKNGAEVPFLRPTELSSDTAKMTDVIEHAIKTYEDYIKDQISIVILLEPTVPFRTVQHINKAIDRYLLGDCKSVVTICPLERKPQNILSKTSGNFVDKYIIEPKEIYYCRQEMKKLCRVSGGAYVVGRDEFLINKSMIIGPIGYVEMKNYESINIDEELDFLLAEIISKKYKI